MDGEVPQAPYKDATGAWSKTLADVAARPSRLKVTKKSHASSLSTDLAADLSGEVRFDDGSRALYTNDASNYRHVPLGVVVPHHVADVIAAVRCCHRHGAPIVHRGGGTSLTGGSVNTAVVIDTSKFVNGIIEINEVQRWALIEPGLVLDDLRAAVAPLHLTFGPDPATHNHCTLGGMIGNNSCGMHAQMAGRVADNVHELDILTYDGERMVVGATTPEQLEAIIATGGRRGDIYRRLKILSERYASLIRQGFPKIPRRVSGYNLDELLPENGFNVARALVGSEGTCVTILSAKLRLVHDHRSRTLLVVGFEDVYAAAAIVPDLLKFGPIGLEGLDEKLVGYVREEGGERAKTLSLLPDGPAFLMIEFGGETKAEADAKTQRLIDFLNRQGHQKSHIKRYDNPSEEKEIWRVREAGLGATAFVKGRVDTWPGWEDAGVAPEKLANYLREFRALLNAHQLDCSLYGHFGQGCIHCRINFDLKTAGGIARYRSFVEAAADLVVRFGGSLSGEHGDGQSRGELLPRMFGPELMDALKEFKRIWDPDGKMNPGKIVDAYPLDANLKLGARYAPPALKTHFRYPDDEGGFAHATLRCVGVGECRRSQGGYMCPSYRVTREEKHTTRGRARMLFEMLQGDAVKKGWRDEHVKEALDLCLSCKGCKGDCPVQVDVATLKAEFLAHYYKGRLRPMAAYSMGLIFWWARIASRVPRLANFFTQTPWLSSCVKFLGGLTRNRPMPAFATQTFRAWFEQRSVRNLGMPQVVLWADTFNNYFHPEVARDAVSVLEEAGYQVLITPERVCCGRPLYDFGFLDAAKRLLQRDLAALAEPIAQGLPIVGLEPSCIAVLRDEMTNLLPDDENAKRLKTRSFVLSEFLCREVRNYQVPKLAKKVTVQMHCHHHGVLKTDDEKSILKNMGIDADILDKGCCGLAGSFGFEHDKYDISMKIGEYGVLPAVRAAPADSLVLADGFSCHTQIAQNTSRKPLHLAQLLRLALAAEGRLPPASQSELS